METNFSVSIIIPNWNGRTLLEKHLPALIAAFKNKKNKIKEIIVVDDKSTDDSISFLKKNYPFIKLIAHTKNRGFSFAVNTGVRMAKSNLVCLLNSDVSPYENFLESAIKLFFDRKVFAVSFHEKGYGYAAGKFTNGFIVYEGKEAAEKVSLSFWANGGSSLFRRKVWMDLKGMDQELLSPLYWEDIDLSYRAQKRGYLVLWDPLAKVIHEHESTVRKLPQRFVATIRERNHLLFIWKNLTSQTLFRKHIKALLAKILRHPGYIRIVLIALRKWRKVRKLRNIEKKESIVSDEAVFAKFN